MDKTLTETKKEHEAQLTEAMGIELTDDQLEQLAEGSSSWGANCNSPSNRGGDCDDQGPVIITQG